MQLIKYVYVCTQVSQLLVQLCAAVQCPGQAGGGQAQPTACCHHRHGHRHEHGHGTHFCHRHSLFYKQQQQQQQSDPGGQSITNYKSKWPASNIWTRDVLCYRIPAPLVRRVQTKTRLESRIKKCKPQLNYDCFSGRPLRAR